MELPRCCAANGTIVVVPPNAAATVALDPVRERRPKILLTEALRGEGVPELWDKIAEHRAYLETDGLLDARRRKNLAGEVFTVADIDERVKQNLTLRFRLGEFDPGGGPYARVKADAAANLRP